MRTRIVLALSNFFAVAHFYLIVYIYTPYLATMISAETAALSIALGAIVTLAVFPYLPRMVVRHGPQKMAIIFAGIEGIILLLLGAQPPALLAVILVALSCAIPPFIVYQLDLMLEASVTDEDTTGRVRTGFVTTGNIALILSPILLSVLLGNSNRYDLVFIAAALSIIPFILLMFVHTLPQIKPPSLRSIRSTGVALFKDHDERAIALSNFLLQFFFHIFPLYVPLYLHTVLGMPWSDLGWVLAVSLIPNVVLEYPAGWLADTQFGDKALLAIGYSIGGLSFASLTFVTATTSIWIILSILVMMRIGTSLIEAMTEAHFFRRVSSDDAEAVSIFRMMRPLGALTAPIIGTILLSTVTYSGLFVFSGFGTLIIGVWAAYMLQNLKDTNVVLKAPVRDIL